jgi:hypothetical protein
VTDETGTTRPDPDDDVRRLLADARHTEPMPADVTARMDEVLADLAQGAPAVTDPSDAGPVPDRPPAPVHPVVASLDRQRRRRAAGMLVAAAAIVVGGVVVAQHLPAPGSSSASSAEDRAGAAVGDTGGDSSGEPTGPEADTSTLAGGRATVQDGRLVVRPRHFPSDAVAARHLLDRVPSATSAYRMLSRVDATCVIPRTQGKHVNATYRRAPAVLVFHPQVSGSQVVDLYVCGSRRPVRSATLPGR